MIFYSLFQLQVIIGISLNKRIENSTRMQFIDELPMPPQDALVHCNQLIHQIKDEIEQTEQGISFRRFMEMALYQPGLGYYVAGMRKIGATGDFITAPEISPLFSQCLARQCADILEVLGVGDILELGAGSGIMAADILKQLDVLACLPEHYYILDISPELKQRQRETLQEHVPHLLDKIIWLEQLPKNFIGVIIGNEVLDAMPVDIFHLHNGQVQQRQVIWQGDYFHYKDIPANKMLLEKVQSFNIPTTDYVSEINSNLNGWFLSLSDSLKQGVILLIDYGYTQQEYYHPERSMGTLLCHYQHRVHDNPLVYPGLQDITASVDFTAVANAASDAGINVSGFTTQAMFLTMTGLEALFTEYLIKYPEQQYTLAQQIRTLSLPAEMGDRFKVIALSKAFTSTLIGFSQGDQRYRL